MRLERAKSYGDLTRGQEQCWMVCDKSQDAVQAITDMIMDSDVEILRVPSSAEEDGNGYATEFVIDTNNVADFKAAYVEAKNCLSTKGVI